MSVTFVRFIAASALALIGLSSPCIQAASEVPHEDLPVGFLPLDRVGSVLKKTLSPGGRHVILAAEASVRVYDSYEKIQEAKRALSELQNSPATLSIQLTVRAGAHRVTRQQYPPEQPIVSYDVPIPQRYDAPRIIGYPGGGVTIVPGLPRNFTTRRVEPGTIVNTCPTGYVTLSPEIRLSETSLEGGVVRKLGGSTGLGKPVVLAVQRKVADARSLRDWALRHDLISEKEPEWAAAGTELLVTSSLSNGYLNLQAVPQIVVYSKDGRQPLRRIAVSAQAASFLAQRNTAMPMQATPSVDTEFYALFFGAGEADADAVTLMSLTANIEYIAQAGE